MRINLLPVDERPLKHDKIRWEFLVSVLGLVLLVIVISVGYTQRLTLETLKQEYQSLLGYRTVLQREASFVNELEARNHDLTKKYDHYQSLLSDHETDFKMLTQVVHSVGYQLWLERLELGANYVLIDGYTSDVIFISEFLHSLSELNYQTKLNQLNPISNGVLTSFSVEAHRR